ncbi:Tetratricopeptide repeat protein 21B [Blyttiomyces sp. JEL0837]|nr:Tetratricopeptide repeat protein 21B [Blyttiomyces sp. JEL0837]
MQGRPAEGLRELQPLMEKRDLILACPLAMIHAHEKCEIVDHESVHELHAKVTIISSGTMVTEKALTQAAMFLWLTGSHDQARQYLKKVLDSGNGSVRSSLTSLSSPTSPGGSGAGTSASVYSFALAIMGWVDLTCGQDNWVSKSITWFDRVLESNPRDLDALMGRLQYLRVQRRQLTPALDITSQIVVYHPTFIPAYIERMYVLLEMGAWDQVVEAAQRLSSLSPDSLDTAAILCLNELCREGRPKIAANHLGNLFSILQKSEPKNAHYFYSLAQPFVRLAGRKDVVLEQAAMMVSRAIDLNPHKSIYKSELGNIDSALECYRSAATQNSHDMTPLHGLIRCYIYKGNFEEAEEQLEFLDAIQSTTMSPETSYLISMMARYRHNNIDKQLKHLREAHNFLRKSQLLYERESRLIDGNSQRFYGSLSNGAQKRRRRSPSTTSSALFYMGKVKYLMGDAVAAQTYAASCLKLDAAHSKAHILTAQIHIANNYPKLAIQSLEMGLSYNFEVRHIPLFHILKARAMKQQGNFEEALSILTTAMQMPGLKDSGAKQIPQIKRSDAIPTLSEKVTLYLELSDTYSKLKRTPEASKVMEDAIRIFQGTSEQHRILIANADLAIERGEIDHALNMLGAKSKMADIYLNHKKDRKAYARCYSELVERHRTVESCLLLGEAYMNIQEPEKAIEVYESALDSFPSHSALACKIGKALVKTHDYGRAISYYESALSKDTMMASTLRYDLSELYYKLKNYDDAERIILEALEHPRSDDMTVLALDVKFNILLAKCYRGAAKYESAVSAFAKAREYQIHILSQEGLNVENKEQKSLISDICFELAETYLTCMKETDRALAYYNEAIQYNSLNKKAMLALCKLYVMQNDLTAAQTQCATMLRLDIATDDATIMMADIMFAKNSYTSAVFHFRQLLEKNPTHYQALKKLIEMMRRSGKLDEADKFFEMAEKSSSKVHLQPGYHFCKGLHYRYTNSPNEALKEFNFCRRDSEWGVESLYNMIEIFLNPDNDTLGGEALEAITDNSSEGGDKGDSDLLAILTADKLIKARELPQNPKALRTQVLECAAWMATKQKSEIDRALSRLTEILNTEKDYVPALLGIAVAHMMLKQPPRARNQLKRIAKMDWTPEFADDFEKSWLLLADIHIQGGKFDLATDLLKKALEQNKSCAKAWEYMGYIMEKEASYKDAAEHYESAWKLERASNPAMGFKLAFNYLKAKKYVEAIDVCHKVIALYPDYPKIRKEIMDKARSLIRV